MRPTIGDQVALRRRQRALTQEQLAEAADVSVETIRKLEQNERTSARMATLHRIARALDVPTSALLGDAARSAARREPDHDQLALMEVRRELTPARGLRAAASVPAPDRACDPGDVRARAAVLDRAYQADDYATALAGLPGLLADLRHTDAAPELVAEVHQLAGTVLTQMGRLDLAHRALDTAFDAAESAGNELLAASVVTVLCWLLLRQGRLDEVEDLAVSTADAVEPRSARVDPIRAATWGWLLARAAAAASRNNSPDRADEYLDGAAAAAVRVSERPLDVPWAGSTPIRTFGAVVVGYKRVESAVIAGRPDQALTLAAQVPAGGRQPTPINRNRHRLDVAWSHVQHRQYVEATGVLLGVRADAPAWLRHQRYARDIVREIATARRRAMSRELADLATLVGVES